VKAFLNQSIIPSMVLYLLKYLKTGVCLIAVSFSSVQKLKLISMSPNRKRYPFYLQWTRSFQLTRQQSKRRFVNPAVVHYYYLIMIKKAHDFS